MLGDGGAPSPSDDPRNTYTRPWKITRAGAPRAGSQVTFSCTPFLALTKYR